jgi:hypothetical protein
MRKTTEKEKAGEHLPNLTFSQPLDLFMASPAQVKRYSYR